MALFNMMKGEPIVTKLARVAMYAVFPGTMVAALIYSPPDYAINKKLQSSSSSSK